MHWGGGESLAPPQFLLLQTTSNDADHLHFRFYELGDFSRGSSSSVNHWSCDSRALSVTFLKVSAFPFLTSNGFGILAAIILAASATWKGGGVAESEAARVRACIKRSCIHWMIAAGMLAQGNLAAWMMHSFLLSGLWATLERWRRAGCFNEEC